MNEYCALAKTKLAITSLSPLHCYMFFIILLACFGAIPSSCVGLMMPPSPCLPSQEEALLKFKAGLTDPTGRLNSWQLGLDCCNWIGITCDNRTGYVTAIDLHNPQNPYDILPFDRYVETRSNSARLSSLGGKLDPALADLKRLQYLNLSYNTFDGKVGIPNFVGSMLELRQLDLSYAGFGGKIPPSVGNLSKLEYLSLSSLIHIDPYSRYPISFYGATRRGQPLTSVLSCDDLQWIGGLTSLKVLSLNQVNLSMVRHQPMQVFNSLPLLEKLALSLCSFSASLNLPFSNFSRLEILDLTYTFSISEFPNWVVNTTSLRNMDISNSDFKGEVPYGLSELPYLTYVNFNYNENFMVNCTKLFTGRWRSLEKMSIFDADFNGGIPSSIGNITSLIQLRVSHSDNRSGDGLEGNIPKELWKLKNLERLGLEYKNFVGSLSPIVFNSKTLKVLQLVGVDLSIANLDWFCQFKVLFYLYLDNCSLRGPIPNCLLQMPSLISLALTSNPSLNGTLPKVLRENSQLESLYLGYNSLQGNIHEGHLQNLKKLVDLELSHNFLVFKPISTWKPPQSLSTIVLPSCQIGPEFPPWLKDAPNLQYLDLSSNRINGSLPGWFWEKLPSLIELNLSHNCIQGHLPNPFTLSYQVDDTILDLGFNMFSGPFPSFTFGADYVDLSNNRLTGPLPPIISVSPDGFSFFIASNNEIDGEIPLAFGNMKMLEALDLSENKLVGSLPPNLIGSTNLLMVDVSGNHLSGGQANLKLPRSNVLRSLYLGQNSLGGAFPSWLKNSTSLEILDLSQNRFFGEIPKWVGTHCISLKILDLRSNIFNGQIPWQLSLLSSLQVLDVAHNSLNGSIPHSFGNFRAMKEKHVVKQWFTPNDGYYYRDQLTISMNGKEDKYGSGNLALVNSLDLSSNKFSGDIPKELTSLYELIVLNLSHNELIHDIPDNIGALKQLLTLDLSHNHLSGTLPSSLGTLTFLNDLNVSYNNFSGEIPTGPQLQTFVESTYIGNPGLCGAPLMKKCLNLGNLGTMGQGGDVNQNEKLLDMFGLYVSVGPGFVVGFWCVWGTLILRPKWRSAYFRFFDEANNRIFVLFVIKLPYLLNRLFRKISITRSNQTNL